MGNAFENNFQYQKKGWKEYDDTPRPNKEALEAKRDEFLIKDFDAVFAGFDSEKMDVIAKALPNIETNAEAREYLNDFVDAVQDQLLKSHGIPEDQSLDGSNKFSPKQIENMENVDEILDTYPRDLIIGHLQARLTSGA